MAMNTVTGVTQFTINGVTYQLAESSVKVEMSTITREPIVSKGGVVFTKETPVAAKLTATIMVPNSVDVSTFNGLSNANIVVSCAGGIVLNAAGFASSGSNSFDVGAGTVELEFYGPRITVTL